jgi:branched-chain amino acid transport system permease protein
LIGEEIGTLKLIKQTLQKQLSPYALYVVLGIILIILPPFTSSYVQSMIVKILIFGIFAMSLNLLWGYTGLFSLGHAAYFGIAGYSTGILIVSYGIGSFWISAPVSVLLATLFAAILGIPALRVGGAYFLLVTLAIGELFYSIAVKWRNVTGGSNGLPGIPYPDLGLPGLTMNATSFYYFIFIAFIISAFLMYRIIHSPFGYALQGIRENEPRMRALGYNTWLYKYIIFIVAGLFAGVAGVLFAHYGRIMVPGHLGVMTSTLAMLMVILGSSSKVFGPVLGAALVVLLEHITSIYIPARWPLILGGVFVISVMFLPGGVGINISKLLKKVFYGSAQG